MSVESGQPRRKTPPRRAPAVVEERERRPFLFGWGSDLNHRERESLKEKIALFGGIGLAIVLVGLLGWGYYHDHVVVPGQQRAAAAVPIAQVGNYTITTGFFKRYEKFQKKEINGQLTQVQQQLLTDKANPKGKKKEISSLEGEQGTLNTQLTQLATNSLTALIDNQTVLQRSKTVGLPITSAITQKAMGQEAKSAGGRLHLQTFIQTTGLSPNEFQSLVVANYMQGKVQSKLAAETPRRQTKVRASHILVSGKKKALAERILHKVLQGGNFATLAKKYSTDTTSAKKGGDLGYFTKTQMIAPFSKAAFSMKIGQVRLVKSQYGWHIIKVTGRKTVTLSKTEYQQAQAQSFQNWLTTQQSKLNVQRLVAPTKLPGAQPQQLPQIPQLPNPPSTKPGASISGNGTTSGGTGKQTTGKAGSGKSQPSPGKKK
ncbi:MAG: peptidylprolyl isomerase [Chloroflexota bacterium]